MYSIGLDIGIASVGWSVIDSNNGKILNLGARIFTARNSDNNTERRNQRGSRRLIRRRKTRLDDTKKLLNDNGYYKDDNLEHVSPYEIRVKGLDHQLTKGEIYRAVTHIVKKRGISYLDEGNIESEPGEDFSSLVIQNAKLLEENTPGQIQLKRLKEGNRVRSGVNDNGEYQLNIFTVKSYANELYRILKFQQQFYSEITDDWIDKFTKSGIGEKAGLVYRKRPYYHGPGNAANNSQYGRWADYKINNEPVENIFNQLIGTDLLGCVRASNLSLSAQKFNLLNDLNNLTFNRDNPKLLPNEKTNIINDLMTGKLKTLTPKEIAKRFETNLESIKGFRVNTSGKPEIHSMDVYRQWKKIFDENGIEILDLPDETLDYIAKVITLNSDLDGAIETFNLDFEKDNSIIKVIIDNYSEFRKKASNNSWHSFSLETINLLLPDLLNTSDEQNTILERLGLKKELRGMYTEYTKIPINAILEEIYNPTVKRSLRQAFNVCNDIIKRYGKENLDNITIEMPRDKNEDDQKATIKKINETNVKRYQQSQEYFLLKSGWDKSLFEDKLKSKRFAQKLLFYFEQDGRCAYSGKAIQPYELDGPQTEIDHIIPLSISFDDSINNKVLVKSEVNQKKGQRSPYDAFINNANFGQSWDDFVVWVKSRNFKKAKQQFLLSEENIFDPESRLKFKNRNLNDTRYASRVVLNILQSFFYNSPTKVKVVTGSFTHTIRKQWNNVLEKSRESYHHHAIDATICAVSPYININQFEFYLDENNKKFMLNPMTGELIDYRDYKSMNYYDKRLFSPIWEDFYTQLLPNTLYPKIKFSHQVDKKMNRKISDATIYSTRERKIEKGKSKTYRIGKIKDIYTVDGWKEYKKNREKLLIKELDPQSFEILESIANSYPEKKEVQQANKKVKSIDVSPFESFRIDNEVSGVKKYSKKGNGPIIKSLKFYDKELKQHINITKDMNGNSVERTKNDKKVVLITTNPWRTDVFYNPKTNTYELLGIKYKDAQFINGEYSISIKKYQELKIQDDISETSEFCFSLYRRDGIKVEYAGEIFEGLFHAKNESNKNYLEIKPIDKPKWNSKEELPVFKTVAASGQFIKGIKSGMKLTKFNMDYLGNKFYTQKEPLNNIIEN